MEKIMVEYQKGSLTGGLHNLTTDNSYVAFTSTISRNFKTRKGAESWLAKSGFIPAVTTIFHEKD